MTEHRLSEYVSALGPGVTVANQPSVDPVIAEVTYDSREVVPGALFICKGVHFRPEFLVQAIERGAVAYLAQHSFDDVEQAVGLPHILVSDMRQAIAATGTLFYDHEWDQLTLVGVTGTKGKSTTAVFLQSILARWQERLGGPRPGLLSSIRYEDGVSCTPSVKTTPETLDLYRHLHNAVASGLKQMCLEVSSQGLRYRRVANLNFEVGCFLNVSEDHISPQEHRDFEDYFTAKLMIFDQSRYAVVNAHTQHYERVMAAADRCERVVRFARIAQLAGSSGAGEIADGAGQIADGTGALKDEAAEVVGFGVVSTPNGQRFTVSYDGEEYDCEIAMPGVFNVDNALAAISVAWLLGVPGQDIRAGLAQARVPGRMQVFRLPNNTTVIVDYAHQKLSFTTLLETVKTEFPGAHITTVFGASGNKGLNRHQELGTLAGQHADEVYLTEDDPGDVPVLEIARDVDAYVRATGHQPAHIVPDRPAAIRQAVANAPVGGLVLVLGKGAEKWQLRAGVNVEVPSDIEVVQSLLNPVA